MSKSQHGPQKHAARAERPREKKHKDESLDEALEESFPASDPAAPAAPATNPKINPEGLKKDAKDACDLEEQGARTYKGK